MTNHSQKWFYYSTKIGSDRHECAIYSNSPPIVEDLLNELEKKTRVPKSSIQLIFKGQKLHNMPDAQLGQFGIFSGNKLQMVGEKVYYKHIFLIISFVFYQ